jgi:hypothetical protein
MSKDRLEFLSLRVLPARLSVEEAGWYLGFSLHEISMLISDGLLKPLGRPPRNGQKYFSSTELEEFRRDIKWMAKASDAIVAYWRRRNKSHQPCAEINQS